MGLTGEGVDAGFPCAGCGGTGGFEEPRPWGDTHVMETVACGYCAGTGKIFVAEGPIEEKLTRELHFVNKRAYACHHCYESLVVESVLPKGDEKARWWQLICVCECDGRNAFMAPITQPDVLGGEKKLSQRIYEARDDSFREHHTTTLEGDEQAKYRSPLSKPLSIPKKKYEPPPVEKMGDKEYAAHMRAKRAKAS